FRTAFQRAWPFGWERARVAALVAIDPLPHDMYYWRCLELADEVSDLLRGKPPGGWQTTPSHRDSDASRKDQIALLHDVFGDPFVSASFDPAWRTPEVMDLAESVAAEGALEDLPVLADALEDAGCSAQAVLSHLRQPGRHALGCWALEIVRGKG